MRFVALLLLFSTTPKVFAATVPEKPNVIIFFMDDMGYGDCRAYNPVSYTHLRAHET